MIQLDATTSATDRLIRAATSNATRDAILVATDIATHILLCEKTIDDTILRVSRLTTHTALDEAIQKIS
jgi:hypothetical protein